MTVSNSGPDSAADVQVSDLLPNGVTYSSHVAGGGTVYDISNGLWNVGVLAGGESAVLTISARIDRGAASLSPIINTAAIVASSLADPDPANNSASVAITASGTEPNIGVPDNNWVTLYCNDSIVVNVSANPIVTHIGYDMVSYEIDSNAPPGYVMMDSIIIEVAQDAGGPWYQVFRWGDTSPDPNTNLGAAGYASGSEPNAMSIPMTNPPFYGPTIRTGVAIDVDAVAPAGTYRFVRYTVPGADCSNSEVDALAPLPASGADLSVRKSVSNSNPLPGDAITYTVTLFNGGPVPADGIEVTDLLPAGLIYAGSALSQGSYDGGTGIWSVGSLSHGGAATLSIQAVVDSGASGWVIANTAALTGSSQPDPDPGDNAASVIVTVQIPPPPVASFTADQTTGAAPLTVTFTDTSTGSITAWSWDFGDGGTSAAQHPSYTYTVPGVYTVTLTVTGPGGSSTQTMTVTVL